MEHPVACLLPNTKYLKLIQLQDITIRCGTPVTCPAKYQILSTALQHFPAQLCQHALCRGFDWALGGKAAGAFMSAAAKPLRDFRHVYRALAADADPDTLMRHFAEKDRHFNAGDTQRVIDEAFAIFIERAKAFHVLPRH